MNRGEQSKNQQALHQGRTGSDTPLVEASSFWVNLGMFSTSCVTALCVASAVMMNTYYEAWAIALTPLATLLYIGALLSQPRRASPKEMWKLCLHFVSFSYISKAANAVFMFRLGQPTFFVIVHVLRAAAMTLIFSFGLKLRRTISQLSDHDLETFLIDTPLKGGLQTLLSILFLGFRTTKCAFEKQSLADCSASTLSSICISLYLLAWWLTKLVHGSVKSEWRKELNLSIEKITKLDISARRVAAGVLVLVAGVCGIFLFSMMSADMGNDEKDGPAVNVIFGYIGGVTSLGEFFFVLYSSLKAQKKLRIESSENERVTEQKKPAAECSWVFVGISFLLTSTYSTLWIFYGVTADNRCELISFIVTSICGNVCVMAFFSKPKRNGVKYKWFLIFHGIPFAFVSEVGSAAGDLQRGWKYSWIFNVFKMFMYALLGWQCSRLRESAAKLPPKDLPEFLC